MWQFSVRRSDIQAVIAEGKTLRRLGAEFFPQDADVLAALDQMIAKLAALGRERGPTMAEAAMKPGEHSHTKTQAAASPPATKGDLAKGIGHLKTTHHQEPRKGVVKESR